MVEILGYNDNGETFDTFLICKERLILDNIYKRGDPLTIISISNIGQEQFIDESIWITDKKFIKDLDSRHSLELVTSLMDFTNKCLNSLGNHDLATIRKTYANHIISSFYMLSVLKIPNNLLVKAFFSVSDQERLEIVQKFITNKKPSRFHLRIVNNNSFYGKYGYLMIFFTLIVIYFSRNPN